VALRPAVFLDRDGVLLEEGSARIFASVGDALRRLHNAGFELVVVTNQTVVARGLARKEDVDAVHRRLREQLPELDAFYVCPHHPNADVERYRVECDCRKPRPGLLLRAAQELDLDLARSYMIGDRISDVAAGAAAGCTTILVRTGAHLAPPIESPDPIPTELHADIECDDLAAAADRILA
jgi:D-glycero-D-manno-heptose 1,7-bisphosphate phosphatase